MMLILVALFVIRLRLKYRQERAEYVEDDLNSLIKKQKEVRKTDAIVN